MLLAPLSTGFKTLSPLPNSKLGPSDADSQVGRFVYILGPCGSLKWSLLCDWEFLLPHQCPKIFTDRGFEALFPWAGALGCAVCLAPQLFLLVYPYANMGAPGPPANALPQSSPSWMPPSAPPTGLDECFFFHSLVVRLPYSSIFWKSWLIFVLKFVVFLLVVQGDKVYLPMPPSLLEGNGFRILSIIFIIFSLNDLLTSSAYFLLGYFSFPCWL